MFTKANQKKQKQTQINTAPIVIGIGD